MPIDLNEHLRKKNQTPPQDTNSERDERDNRRGTGGNKRDDGSRGSSPRDPFGQGFSIRQIWLAAGLSPYLLLC